MKKYIIGIVIIIIIITGICLINYKNKDIIFEEFTDVRLSDKINGTVILENGIILDFEVPKEEWYDTEEKIYKRKRLILKNSQQRDQKIPKEDINKMIECIEIIDENYEYMQENDFEPDVMREQVDYYAYIYNKNKKKIIIYETYNSIYNRDENKNEILEILRKY